MAEWCLANVLARPSRSFGYPEANHAVQRDYRILCNGRRVIENAYQGQIDLTSSPNVREQAQMLVSKARVFLDAIRNLGADKSDDPIADATVLANVVQPGLMDTP